MRQLIFILIFISFGAGQVIAQSADSVIHDIRKEYQDIRNNLTSYDTTMVSIWDESTEGAQGIAYWNDGKIRLIEVEWFGEMGKRKIEYYFDVEQLFFVFNTDYKYNRPIYWDEERAKEIGDTEFFDESKSVIRENRYYFHDGKLIRWIDESKKMVTIYSQAATKRESELKKQVDYIKAKLEK